MLGLKSGTTFLGLLLLGPKTNNRFFAGKELQIYATLANQVAVSLENALRYEALQDSRDQLQEMFNKVVQSEKLATIGEMTAVLAHEIKNPLGVIRSSAEYLNKKERNALIRKELMQNIVEEVDGMNLVVNNLLGLARYKPPEFIPLDPAENLASLIVRWEISAGHNRAVKITLEDAYHGAKVCADENQLSQVFLNLIQNGEEAMPNAGDLSIKIAAPPKDDGVIIFFTDRGAGISSEDIHELFKKFFTTKEKGSGLGLAVCRQIIMMHDGSIELYNNEGPGVTVRIRLPCRPHCVSGEIAQGRL